jgi:hypothetical protein
MQHYHSPFVTITIAYGYVYRRRDQLLVDVAHVRRISSKNRPVV